jgi:hypothetical protein
MENQFILNGLENPAPLNKLVSGKENEFRFNQESKWVDELLTEMHEQTTGLPPSEFNKRSSVNIELTIKRDNNAEIGEYVLMTGKVEIDFFVNCVKTLVLMKDKLDIEFKCCFISNTLEESEIYADQIEVYMESNMWELYFYDKRNIDIKEMVHEYIHLNKNSYPTREISKEDQIDPSDQAQ